MGQSIPVARRVTTRYGIQQGGYVMNRESIISDGLRAMLFGRTTFYAGSWILARDLRTMFFGKTSFGHQNIVLWVPDMLRGVTLLR